MDDSDAVRAALLELARELDGDAEAIERAATPLPAAEERLAILTTRQRQVLGWMSRGLRNKQIAAELGIDEKTVKMHRAAVLDRLGSVTSADAVRFAVEAGL